VFNLFAPWAHNLTGNVQEYLQVEEDL